MFSFGTISRMDRSYIQLIPAYCFQRHYTRDTPKMLLRVCGLYDLII